MITLTSFSYINPPEWQQYAYLSFVHLSGFVMKRYVLMDLIIFSKFYNCFLDIREDKYSQTTKKWNEAISSQYLGMIKKPITWKLLVIQSTNADMH